MTVTRVTVPTPPPLLLTAGSPAGEKTRFKLGYSTDVGGQDFFNNVSSVLLTSKAQMKVEVMDWDKIQQNLTDVS